MSDIEVRFKWYHTPLFSLIVMVCAPILLVREWWLGEEKGE